MSFGNSSPVHNHLSTKHPDFPHRLLQEKQEEKIVGPLHDEERFAERAPPAKEDEPVDNPSHA
jgi:hypothetical protein